MRNIQRRNRIKHQVGGKFRPLFDRLEIRTALSGFSFDPSGFGSSSSFGNSPNSTPLTITSTTPSNLASLTTSPTTLVVSFDRPLSGFSLGIEDFELVRVNGDGSTSPLEPNEEIIQEALDPADPTGSEIDLTLNRPLGSGQYELLLLASSQISGEDGSQLANTGVGQVVSEFQIAAPQTGIQEATNLGTIGATVVDQSGNLSLVSNPGAVDYYRIDLAPGHRWRLGLAVDSQSTPTTLSLFDSSGKLIVTDSTGLQDSPEEPFLFQGLDPGTYYVGISARGNVPDTDGVYDPSSADLATQIDSLGVGNFQLQAVADTADQPTSVLGIRLDRADPDTNTPTGLTIQFSGAIQVDGLQIQETPPLELVDQSGRSWGVTIVSYNPTLGQLQVAFDQPLEAGTYSLELTSSTSLVDLADSIPIAPGLASGQLAKFAVSSPVPLPAGDLGPLYSGPNSSTMVANVLVDSKSTSSEQFEVLEPGVYSILGVLPSSGLSFTIQNAQGTILASGPQDAVGGEIFVSLEQGIYKLVLTNPVDRSVLVPLTITHKTTIFSQLMDGGIAQGAALNLRLVTPQANFGLGTNLVSPTTGNPIGLTLASPTTSVSSREIVPSSGKLENVIVSPGNSTDIGLLLGLGPIGLPSVQSNQISFVGSTGMPGALALASNSATLSPGLIGIPETNSNGSTELSEITPFDDLSQLEIRPDTSRISSTDVGLLARTPRSRLADEQSLASAEWLSQLVAKAFGAVGDLSFPAQGPALEGDAMPMIVANAFSGAVSAPPRVERATIALPIGFAVGLGALVYRYRTTLFARNRLREKATTEPSKVHRPVFAGPHDSIGNKHLVH